MDYPVVAPELAGRSVLVRVAGMFADPQIVVDGTEVKPVDGLYLVPKTGDTASEATLRLRAPLLDFVPIVLVNDRRVEIAPALAWWQYLWALLPTLLLLVIVRGVLPALIGIALSYFSVFLIRSQPQRRYLWTALINVGVVLAIAGLTAVLIAVKLAARHAAAAGTH